MTISINKKISISTFLYSEVYSKINNLINFIN